MYVQLELCLIRTDPRTRSLGEEMLRLRTERVKEMLLLSGLRRGRFWLAYFLAHLAFFQLAWGLSYARMLNTGGP